MRLPDGVVPMFAAAVLMLAGLACRHEQPYEKPAAPVQVEVVGSSAGRTPVKYSGSIEPKLRVDLSFRVSGYIQQIQMVPQSGAAAERLVQEGDRVRAGAVLARLRDTDYVAKVKA